MMLRALIARGTSALDQAGIPNAARDARLLAAHVCDIDPSRVTLHEMDEVSEAAIARFDDAITQRQNHRPVSRIIGVRQFWGRNFQITDDVLDPRGDTETLISEALKTPAKRILDLGTGSGILGITLATEQVDAVVAVTDISQAALAVAIANAKRYHVEDRIEFIQSDWFDSLHGKFDLIISNPPYIGENELEGLEPDVIDYDPIIALTPGGDGLAPYRIIAAQAKDYLNENGRVIVEIGHIQGNDVRNLFLNAGFMNVQILQDLDGKDRAIVAKHPV
jgi:release factor glutamine methyltransferase